MLMRAVAPRLDLRLPDPRLGGALRLMVTSETFGVLPTARTRCAVIQRYCQAADPSTYSPRAARTGLRPQLLTATTWHPAFSYIPNVPSPISPYWPTRTWGGLCSGPVCGDL